MPAKRRPRAEPRPALTEREEGRHLEEQFRRLVAASARIFSQHTLPTVLQAVVDTARVLVGARYAALGLLAPDGAGFEHFVTSGIDQATRERIGAPPTGQGLLGVVIRERRVIRTADIAHHPQRYGFPAHHPAMRSFLGVPITAYDKVLGNLYLTEKLDAVEFDEQDEDVAEMLAAQAAVAVQNARLNESSAQLLSQLRTMQRQRDLFFAMMNHELRNALTSVYGWAERLLRKRSPESAEQAAREVYEGTERTITLLNNFLDLTRLDAGRMQPVRREVDPEVVVQRVLTGFEPAAEGKQLTLKTELSKKPPVVLTDPVRLQQILVNLVGNAVRHTPSGGCIELTVVGDSSMVEFRVRDDGPGIPAEAQERIFEPFEQESGVGTGLGLPVSRRLAEVLGGKLSLKSVPGQGATFTLVLPLRPAE